MCFRISNTTFATITNAQYLLEYDRMMEARTVADSSGPAHVDGQARARGAISPTRLEASGDPRSACLAHCDWSIVA